MENLQNEFVVNRPIEQAWAVLTDVERIAPCLPGAQLQEIEGESYRGVVKVKLGPISTAFKGQAHFVERDDAGHRALLRGEGRDTGGKGNADALITAELVALTDTTSKCTVSTELRVTGKVAQFGRGVIVDVSSKLISQFVANVEKMVNEDNAAADAAATGNSAADNSATDTAAADTAAADTAPTDSAPADNSATDNSAAAEAAVDAATDPAPGTSPEAAAPTIRKIDSAEAAPVDLFELTGAPVAKRLAPVAAIAALAGLVAVIWRRRSR